QLLDRGLEPEVDRVVAWRLGVRVLEGATHGLGQGVHVVHERTGIGRDGAERARLEERVLRDEAPDGVLELVVAVEWEGQGRALMGPGKGVAARLEDEHLLPGRRQHVRRRAAARAAADDAEVEGPGEALVPENVVVRHRLAHSPKIAAAVTIESWMWVASSE